MSAPPAAAPPAATSGPAADDEYPGAERLDLTDRIHGTPIADPYRWLEDPDDARTVAWSEQQDLRYAGWLARTQSPSQAELRSAIAAFAAAGGSVSVPVWRGGRLFQTRHDPGREHAVLYVADAEADVDADVVTDAGEAGVAQPGAERELIDPGALDPSGTTTLDGWFPSADGALLAYFLSVGGTERPRLRVMDVASGADVEDPIDDVASFAFAWLPDGSGFYYQRRPTAEQVAEGVLGVHMLVYLHRLGTAAERDVLISRPERGVPASSWFTPAVSPDGRWLRLDAEWGVASNDVYLADLTAGPAEAPAFTNLGVDPEVKTELSFRRDGRIIAYTFADAPNGRLCLVDPDRPAYEHWRTLLPEDRDAVLKGFTVLAGEGAGGPRLLALRARHAVSELTLYDLDDLDGAAPAGPVSDGPASGSPASSGPAAGSAVELPDLGTVRDLTAGPDGSCAYFTYTDFRTPPGVYRFDVRDGAVSPQASGRVPASAAKTPSAPVVDPGRIRVRMQVCEVGFRSGDGTEVRMFVLSPTGRPDRPRPAILYGYGSHGNSRVPAFSPLQAAWVEAGGVFAIAKVRGGGEEGEAWHRAGMRENRQNTFADFHAAGDHLVDQGWTTRDRLGAYGVSAGGQMVGVALAQRPGAYRAAVCSSAQLDMIRAAQTGLAALWVGERGSVDDPEQFGWVLAQSPYHMLHDATAYPALLLTASEGDARVPTWHARKFAAAIQHATSAPPAERPILLRREAGVGHSTRAVSRSVALWSEQLAFFAAQLGLGSEE